MDEWVVDAFSVFKKNAVGGGNVILGSELSNIASITTNSMYSTDSVSTYGTSYTYSFKCVLLMYNIIMIQFHCG